MCLIFKQPMELCGHETTRTQRCEFWPNCFTRHITLDPIMDLCDSCHLEMLPNHHQDAPRVAHMGQRTSHSNGHTVHTSSYVIEFPEQQSSGVNRPAPLEIPPTRNIAQDRHPANVSPVPRSPIPFEPDDATPHLTALRLHRERMVELEASFQRLMGNMHLPDFDNILPGPGNGTNNVAELVSNLHEPIAELNRQYVDQLRGAIEILESLDYQPNPEQRREAAGNRPRGRDSPAPAPRGEPGPTLGQNDFQEYSPVSNEDVPDMPNFPDAALDAQFQENRVGEGAQQPRPRGDDSGEVMTRISHNSVPEDERQCPVCRDDLVPGNEIEHPVRLPCGHIFGDRCIETWFSTNTTCPICRRRYDL